MLVQAAAHAPVHTPRQVFQALLARAQSGGQRSWVALDLDGTLFDNRPRTLAILRAFALTHRESIPELLPLIERTSLDDLHYSPGQAVAALGLPHTQLADDFVKFWRDRFFTNAFQALDHVEKGAVEFAQRLVDAGLGIVYLTGRDRPGMMQGTLHSLDSHGFPLMSPQTQVVLKPDFAAPDVAFKRSAIAELLRNGPLVGLFDNEPGICNMALQAAPGIVSVRMLRAFAPDPPTLDARVVQIESFQL